MGKTRLADCVIACYFAAAFLAAEAVASLEELRRQALLREAAPMPARLTAEFRSAASRVDPEEPA